MTPQTKTIIYWSLGIVALGGLVWGAVKIFKKPGSGTVSGGPAPSNEMKIGRPLYSSVTRKLLQHVDGGAEPCYESTFSAGEPLGTYLGDVDYGAVYTSITSACPGQKRQALLYGSGSTQFEGKFAKVSRTGNQTLFLKKSADLYTK